MIEIKRVYEAYSPTDGTRILVDRLWPRGVTRDELKFDIWAKNLAPSQSLRKWFGHLPDRFPEFTRRYVAELNQNVELNAIIPLENTQNITLLYAAKDEKCNHAAVLADFLRDRLSHHRL